MRRSKNNIWIRYKNAQEQKRPDRAGEVTARARAGLRPPLDALYALRGGGGLAVEEVTPPALVVRMDRKRAHAKAKRTNGIVKCCGAHTHVHTTRRDLPEHGGDGGAEDDVGIVGHVKVALPDIYYIILYYIILYYIIFYYFIPYND
jgi:hypothetical protein